MPEELEFPEEISKFADEKEVDSYELIVHGKIVPVDDGGWGWVVKSNEE